MVLQPVITLPRCLFVYWFKNAGYQCIRTVHSDGDHDYTGAMAIPITEQNVMEIMREQDAIRRVSRRRSL